MKTMFALALLTISIAPWAAADSSLTEAMERTVRVWVPDKVVGRLVAFDAQTFTIKPATGEARVFERSVIQKMDVARGTGFHVGMTFAGAGAGALTALTVALVVCDSRSSSGDTTACDSASWGDVGVIALAGAALGAVVAGLATKNAGWEDVADFNHPRVSAVIVPRRRGVGVLVSVRF